MADETIFGTRGFLKWQQGGPILDDHDLLECRINGATAQIGDVVTRSGESEPDVALAEINDVPLGVIAEIVDILAVLAVDPDWDIDTAIPDNQYIRVARCGSNAIGPVNLVAKAGPVAVVQNDRLVIGSAAGTVAKFAYTDASIATDTLHDSVGSVQEPDAGSTGDDHYILARLD